MIMKTGFYVNVKWKVVLLIIVFGSCWNVSAQKKNYQVSTVAFYNVENLFDTIRNPEIYDEEWTPTGAQHWTSKKYNQKIHNLASVISIIGTDENPEMPAIVGVAEVENRGVLEDLISQPELASGNYGIVHYDSPDKRGIDVGLLYRKDHFQVLASQPVTLMIKDMSKIDFKTKEKGVRVYTRDQLVVTGLLDGEEIHFIVNHWPSRVGGEKRSSPFREAAAALNLKIIDSLKAINPKAKVIAMGDLNDGPYNKSMTNVLQAVDDKEKVGDTGIFNPMQKMAKQGLGTLAYRDGWDVFDQIYMTASVVNGNYNTWTFWKAGIFKKPFLIQQDGKFKGYPLRNSNSEVGYSDHFPVYIYLLKEAK